MKKEDASKPVSMSELREVLGAVLSEERAVSNKNLQEVMKKERLYAQKQFHEERVYTTALIQQSTQTVVNKIDRVKTMLAEDHIKLADTVKTHTKQITVLKRDIATLKA